MSAGAIERAVMKWRAEGVELNPGATDEAIARLERHLGTTLPADVRSFFALADGFEGGGCAGESLLSFWSIEKILSEVIDPGWEFDRRDTPVADVMLDSWFLYLRRLGEGRVGVWVEGADLELASLEEFFERYERDPDSLCL